VATVAEKPDVLLARHCKGTRILLVEDNPVNQKVALAVLKRAALEVEIAGDGRQAVDFVREREYALVLMDVQMPVLDGIAATREIRTLPNRATLPIIAMTANAFDEDRRECLNAGMSDFIGKPVVPSNLYRTLLHWLAPGAAEGEPQATSSAGSQSVARAADDVRVGQLLGYVETLLREGDMRVIGVWRESAPLIEAALGPVAERLHQEIEAFHFGLALTTLLGARAGSRPTADQTGAVPVRPAV